MTFCCTSFCPDYNKIPPSFNASWSTRPLCSPIFFTVWRGIYLLIVVWDFCSTKSSLLKIGFCCSLCREIRSRPYQRFEERWEVSFIKGWIATSQWKSSRNKAMNYLTTTFGSLFHRKNKLPPRLIWLWTGIGYFYEKGRCTKWGTTWRSIWSALASTNRLPYQ